jgi:hypothetical protein
MRWYFGTLYGVSTVLLLGFVAWIITRILHLDGANYVAGRVILYDLYAIGVLLAYTAFVGGWHLWEKLTGRMEPASDAPEARAETTAER